MDKERRVYLAFGSNLGDRRANILSAVELLDKYLGTSRERLSSLYETEAEGFDGPPFLNAAGLWTTKDDPHEILRICKLVERELGRENEGIHLDAEGRRIYRSRPVDIDILLIGDERIQTPTLTVPHPRMEEREFVMLPLREIFEGID